MEKIDRLGWAAGIAVTAYGRTIGVRSNDPALLDRLAACMPFGSRPSGAAVVDHLYSVFVAPPTDNPRLRRFHLAYSGAARITRTLELGQIFEAVERDSRQFVAEYARRRVFVHAAVVGWRGRAIVIPGNSLAGKTTLAAELVRGGAVYYSDEYAVFDAQGRVHPFAKALSIRHDGDGYRQTDYPVEAFGGRAGKKPLQVGAVLVTHYRSGAKWRPRLLSSGLGAMALLGHTIAVRHHPEKALDVLSNAVAEAAVWKGVRGEAAAVLKFLRENGDLNSNSVRKAS